MTDQDTIESRIESGESFADLVDDGSDRDRTNDAHRDESPTELLGRVGSALSRRSFMHGVGAAGLGAVALSVVGSGVAAADHEPPIYGLTLVPHEDSEMGLALLATDDGNAVVGVDLDSGTIKTDHAVHVQGVADGRTLLGLDYRPSDGMLYSLDGHGQLYRMDVPSSGASSVSAHTVGSPADYPDTDLSAGIGFDFNPVADAIRVVTTDGDSFVTNADDGTIIRQDPDTFYAEGDANAGTDPQLSAAGYTNSVPDPETTMLYDIDSNLDVLVQQNANPDSPDTSALTTIGSLGVDVGAVNGFDISGSDGTAYALFVVDGASELYTVDLMTGLASRVGDDKGGMGDVTDVDILNFALTLEHLEANYYTEALKIYSEDDFEGFGSPGMETFSGGRPRYGTYQQYEKIRDHEVAHVEALRATIKDLGGTPVEAAEYEFPYSSIEEFVNLSATIENVGVSAYAGAAPLIENDEILAAAASIHSVEARHATYIMLQRNGGAPPFGGAFDPARSMEEVVDIASQFIVS
ncbi:DUF4394 domain-containing protein [Halomarina oriensis]|uniref:DUF4394 domain-containing protein n=1 Tax=Halomarina oriensis TaxID=671145 RepID=A0A6B0GR01_9EURY|nr:DUF4394 domain-containing protein [Halomarina oriensis]MWG35787.1 DUF4394 domain-containing protein [Halomarina oriensis]